MAITAEGLQQLGFTPEVDFSLQNDGDGTFVAKWKSELPQPSVDDIEAAHAEWQAEYDSQEYARKREQEYPSIQECVHAILDDDLDALQAKRAEVKARYPK